MSVITVEQAICILLPEFGNIVFVQELILDKNSRLYYLARDMVAFYLLPYIHGSMLPKKHQEPQNVVQEVDPTKYKSYDRNICWIQSIYNPHDIRPCSQLVSIQLPNYDCFISCDSIYILANNKTVCVYQHSHEDIKSWHYVGNNIILYRDDDPEIDYLWKYYGYKVETNGTIRKFKYGKIMDLMWDITILPCGLVYCDGFTKDDLIDDMSISNDYDGPYTFHKVINFMKEPPEEVKTTSALGDGSPWHFINDRGERVCYKGCEGSDFRPRPRSSNIM